MRTFCKNFYNWMVYLLFKGLYQINKVISSCKIEIETEIEIEIEIALSNACTDTEKTIQKTSYCISSKQTS